MNRPLLALAPTSLLLAAILALPACKRQPAASAPASAPFAAAPAHPTPSDAAAAQPVPENLPPARPARRNFNVEEDVIAAIRDLNGEFGTNPSAPDNPIIWVRFNSPKVTDQALVFLDFIPTLARIDLSSTNVTDAVFSRFQDLLRLRALNLRSTSITDAGLARLAVLTEIQDLDLSHTAVTDAGLKQLRPLARLHTLNLAYDDITDAAVGELKAFQSLQDLGLAHTHVTDAGAQRLQQLLPDCEITGPSGVQVPRPDPPIADAAQAAAVKKFEQMGGSVEFDFKTKLPRSFMLGSTHITDDNLADLALFPEISQVELREEETAITDAGLERAADQP